MRKLQGRLYYQELVRQEAFSATIKSSTAYSFSAKNLTEKQCLALFRGYWSLSRYWKALPQALRTKLLPRLASCAGGSAHAQCQATWTSTWCVDSFNQKVDPSPHNFGPLEKLERILPPLPSLFSFFNTVPSQSNLTPCGLSELDKIIKQLRDTLADHFLGPRA